FGLKHQGYNELANANRSEQAEKYQYNGKEFEDSFGLNIYEMDLRQYDPAIGRWTVQDPVIHHEFSPYSAFDNNPAYWADPSGADAVPVSVMDLFNAAEGDITTFTFVNGSLIGTETYMVEELLQNLYELRPLEGTEYEGSKGNAYGGGGGGNGNGGGKGTKLHGGPFDGQNVNSLNQENFPYFSQSVTTFDYFQLREFEQRMVENMNNTGSLMIKVAAFFGGKSAISLKDITDMKKFLKGLNPSTLLFTAIALQGKDLQANATILSQIKSRYDNLNPSDIGQGVFMIRQHISAPAFGGMGSTNYYFYTISNNQYLGSFTN